MKNESRGDVYWLIFVVTEFLYRYAKFICNRLNLVIFSPICTQNCTVRTLRSIFPKRKLQTITIFHIKSTKKWVVSALKILKRVSISSKTRTAIGLKFCRNIELYYKQKELRNTISQLFYVYTSSSFNFDFFLLFPYKSAIIIVFKRSVWYTKLV